ncbi:FAD/NAD(P)-binding domain-containing protein [Peniophora sp. CONT]|nr:FAD/NAD(P)-binding domain-containing protein [Peniophora sp. CONT]
MSTPIITPRLRVAICGGGLGGLTLANALSRTKDIAVDVYEATAEFTEIGAGVSVRPRTLRFMAELGLFEDLHAISGKPPGADKDGPAISSFGADKPDMELMSNDFVKGTVMLHRAQFHNVLFKHIPGHVGMHASKRLVSYTDPEDVNSPVILTFADETEAMCDLLVGADGVKSAVRATMYEGLASRAETEEKAEELRGRIPPRFSGAIAYRGVIPREKLIKDVPAERSAWHVGKIYPGDSMYLITYPIAQGSLLNVVVLTRDMSLEGTEHPLPWVELTGLEELKHYLEHAAPEPRTILAALEGIEMRKWVINVVPPLDEWTVGRALLFGDAAHAMTPDQGAGAGQAIEDAQILSTLLAHPRATRDTIRRLLRAHTDVRKPVATEFFLAARKNGMLMSDASVPLEEFVAQMHELAESVWSKGSPEGNAQRAVDLFEAALADFADE